MLADLRGDRVAEVTRRFDGSRMSASDRLHAVRQAVDSTLASGDVEPTQVLVVCVGLPGPVAADGHVTVIEEFEPWHTDLWSAIHEWYQWHAIVDNDANLAAVAERWRGAATGTDNFIVMLAGERLGSGLVVDGKLLRGSAGGAGEMAFLDLIDAVGSAWGVVWHARNLGSEAVARQRQAGPARPHSLRRRCDDDPDSLTAEMVFDAASAGDPLALGVVDEIAVKLAHTIAAMASLLNPELVVISGGVASACNVLLEPLKRRLQRLTPRPPEVVTPALGDKAVTIGAVRAALDDFSATFLQSLRPVESG